MMTEDKKVEVKIADFEKAIDIALEAKEKYKQELENLKDK